MIRRSATMTSLVYGEGSRKQPASIDAGRRGRSKCRIPLIAIPYFDWRIAVEFQRVQARSLDRDPDVIWGRWRAGEVPA
jgi:hypothetical protein